MGVWINTEAIIDEAVTADKIATGAIDATDKVADDIITAAKFTSQANNCAWYGYNTYGDCVYG